MRFPGRTNLAYFGTYFRGRGPRGIISRRYTTPYALSNYLLAPLYEFKAAWRIADSPRSGCEKGWAHPPYLLAPPYEFEAECKTADASRSVRMQGLPPIALTIKTTERPRDDIIEKVTRAIHQRDNLPCLQYAVDFLNLC